MVELWDLYDSERHKLPVMHIRGRRMRKGTYHVSVGIWTVNSKNEVLITLRSPLKRDWANMWENTAGSVISGETSRQGAVRELKEETGIEVTEDELYFLGSEQGGNTIGDCYIVRKDVPIEDVVMQDGETCDARWVTIPQLDSMISKGLVAPPVAGRLKNIRKKWEDFIMGNIGAEKDKERVPVKRADILLPAANFDKWAVVACDQYTSEPEYWSELTEKVGDAPSTLKMILPEVYLGGNDVQQRIEKANAAMSKYLDEGVMKEYKNTMIFTERTLPDGRVRRGIVAALDLAAYNYEKGTKPLIRATEGTVLSRIPPRVKIRENAPLELPHIMILVDDPDNKVIPKQPSGDIVYDTELLMGGGKLRGSLISDEAIDGIITALAEMMQGRDDPMLLAVGDGNHSLATAKACYDENNELSHYALAEIVNIHDPALDFEPIYRVLFGVDPADVIAEAKKYFDGSTEHEVKCVYGANKDSFYADGLVAGTLQEFIDGYVKSHDGASVDYIHGEDAVKKLASEKGSVGFIFDGISKSELFPYVEKNGSLPRKTFSMGHAYDKRYYMECRKIR